MEDLSRRSFVGSAAALAVTTYILGAPSAYGTEFISLTHEGQTSYRFNPDFTTALPWVAPGLIRLRASVSAIKDSTLQVSWDSRLADMASPSSVVAAGGHVQLISGISGQGSSANSQTLRLPLSALTAKGNGITEWLLAPQIFAKQDARDAGIDDIQQTLAEIITPTGRKRRDADAARRLPNKAVEGSVWGGEVSVLWDGASQGFEASRSTYPRLVSLMSVGPGPIPAGSQIVLSADSVAIGTLQLLKAIRDDVTSVAVRRDVEQLNGLTTLVLTLNEPLPESSQIVFELEAAKETTTNPSARTQSACAVSLRSGTGPLALQRNTGREAQVLITSGGTI